MTDQSTDSGLSGLREALEKIKKLKPSPIGDTGFQTGPQALFDAARRIAKEALAAHQAGEKVSAPSQGGDGWIEWAGGENPVPGQVVSVRYRTGAEPEAGRSDDWVWDHDCHPGHAGNIIAYRVAPNTTGKAPEAAREGGR